MSDFSIGGKLWPGISKLIEEAGEVQQVCGKLIGSRGEVKHWDGSDLRDRLVEEVADVLAACQFVMEANDLDIDAMQERTEAKLALFWKWHAPQPATPEPTKVDGAPKCNYATMRPADMDYRHPACPVHGSERACELAIAPTPKPRRRTRKGAR
jgi:NTP pyrophosphatase (non-canonical NTP hydrolase)